MNCLYFAVNLLYTLYNIYVIISIDKVTFSHVNLYYMTKEVFRMTNKKTSVKTVVRNVVDESELLLAYQRQCDADILQASIESVNSCVSSQERFVQAINLLCKQDSDFTVKALAYKSKQRNLLFKNQKIVYFTSNFVNVTKSQADKYSVQIMSIKHYNHAYCYNVAVETYKTYEQIKTLVYTIANAQ